VTPDELRVIGYLDPRRALGFFEELPGGTEVWAGDLGASADPDQALLAAIRLHEADPGLVRGLIDDSRARARLCAVLGGSQWLGDYIIADPSRARATWEDPGDAGRAIHWRSTARVGKLMVRQFEETRRSHLLIVLDLDTDAWASDEEFEIGVSAAASMPGEAWPPAVD